MSAPTSGPTSGPHAEPHDGAGGSPGAAAAVILGVVAADQFTKQLAVEKLSPPHIPHEVIGEYARFTLTYNPGAAFGMHLGSLSRWIFAGLTIVILGFLVRLYRATPRHDGPLRLAIASVMGGALGNLVDRFRSPLGVVDFIDVGVGDVRFWTFNVADAAVSVGAVCLVILLWRRDLAHTARVHAEHGRAVPEPSAEAVPEAGQSAGER